MTYQCLQHHVRCRVTTEGRRYDLPGVTFQGTLSPPSCALLLAPDIHAGTLPFLDEMDRPTARACVIEEVD